MKSGSSAKSPHPLICDFNYICHCKKYYMKYLFFIMVIGIGCTSADKPAAVATNPKDSTTIQWIDSIEQNIGKINQGEVVEILWHFKNSGDKPLIISDVKPGCGCTGADGPKEPIAPGKEGIITGKFDSKNYPGTQTKKVTVTANILNTKFDKGQEQLGFTVEVTPKK